MSNCLLKPADTAVSICATSWRSRLGTQSSARKAVLRSAGCLLLLMAVAISPVYAQYKNQPTIKKAERKESFIPLKFPLPHLKRIPPKTGSLAAHPCTKEYNYRLEDYLAAIPDEKIAYYQEAAYSDTMFLLSQIVREDKDGKRYAPYRERWFQKAVDLGHPIARYQAALPAQLKHAAEYPMSIGLGIVLVKEPDAKDLEFLKLAEAATEQQGSGEIAWQMANAYAKTGLAPEEFQFLPASPDKARQWAIKAAERGNIPAAEALCHAYSNGDSRYGIRANDAASGEQAAQWCLLAAQASCSAAGAFGLAKLFETGKGLPKSALDELCWRKRGEMREWRLNGSQGTKPYEIKKFPYTYSSQWRLPYGTEACAGIRIVELTNILRPDELAVYEARAAKGDADAMYLLSRVLKLDAEGKVDDSAREKWQTRAAEAGSPFARYEIAFAPIREADRFTPEEVKQHQEGLARIKPLLEDATRAEGSGGMAWDLVRAFEAHEHGKRFGVKEYDVFSMMYRNFFPISYVEAQKWAKLAAGRGNVHAVGRACYEHLRKRADWPTRFNFADGKMFCVLEAAGAPGREAGGNLAVVYQDGSGYLKSALDNLYWGSMAQESRFFIQSKDEGIQGEKNYE